MERWIFKKIISPLNPPISQNIQMNFLDKSIKSKTILNDTRFI